jgi:hypothetical protein
MRDPNVRWAIRRRVSPNPDCWIGSVSGKWVTDWGSRRLFWNDEDAKLQMQSLKEDGVTGLKVIRITRKEDRNIPHEEARERLGLGSDK